LTGFTGLTGEQQAKGKTGAVSILLILFESLRTQSKKIFDLQD
jgi:hypothetical protein